jgi:excinuclease ABC subunit A
MHPDEILIRGAKEHNLKNIDVRLPRFKLVVITGVSGSGKSSLVAQTLHPALAQVLHGAIQKPSEHVRIEGPAFQVGHSPRLEDAQDSPLKIRNDVKMSFEPF